MTKKIALSCMLSCFMFAASGIAPRRGEAATLGIGATSWSVWWEPRPNISAASADPGIMYGPQLLLSLSSQLSISSVFLYGTFSYSQFDDEYTVARYDSDTTVTYALHRYVRVFGGLKVMGYSWPGGSQRDLGPGLGIGFVAPFRDDLFCAANVSGLYLWGNQEDTNDSNFNYSLSIWGVNTTLSLIYVWSSSVNLTLGGRYFYFRTVPMGESNRPYREADHFYGVTASAIYMINL